MKKILSSLVSLAMLAGSTLPSAFAADTVKVTFDENNGTEPYSIEVEKGEILHELPAPDVDATHVATGWYSDKEATEVFDITQPVTEDITIYAGWHAPMQFTDIDESNPFYDAVCNVYFTDVMNGISETEFAPDATLTRAMLVTILYRYEGEPAFMNDLVFNDVEEGSYYEKAVVWANGKGIVNGVSETEFAPSQNITREQLAAIMYRYAKYKEIPIDKASEDTNTLSYDDFMDIAEYASAAVHSCLATGVLISRGTKIEPASDATRAEAAQAISAIGTIFVDEPLSYAELAGSYSDGVSQRGTLVAQATDNGLNITVLWGNSAFETMQWTMNASYAENGTLAYTDCVEKVITTDANGKETEKIDYENGSGFFSVSHGALYWNGAENENCSKLFFEKNPIEPAIGIPNPMVEVTSEEFSQKLGFHLGVPEGAKNVQYYIIGSELGEMMFMLDGMEYTARIKAADEYEDISGMYFDRTTTDDCNIKGRPGKVMRYISKEENSMDDVCLWYDEAPGIMYSLATYDTDLFGFDITAIADRVFVPMQSDAE